MGRPSKSIKATTEPTEAIVVSHRGRYATRSRWRNRVRFARPLRLSLIESLVDHLDARRCGKAGLPVSGTDSLGTPRTAEMRHAHHDQSEAERLGCSEDTSPTEVALEERRRRMLQLQGVIDQSTCDVAETLASLPSGRRPAEMHLDDAVVSARRAAEGRRATAAQQGALAQAIAERDAVGLEIARIERVIRMRWETAFDRVRRLTERAGRREDRYWRILSLRHPEGAALLGVLGQTGPELPAWVRDPGTNPFEEDQ